MMTIIRPISLPSKYDSSTMKITTEKHLMGVLKFSRSNEILSAMVVKTYTITIT